MNGLFGNGNKPKKVYLGMEINQRLFIWEWKWNKVCLFLNQNKIIARIRRLSDRIGDEID